MIDPRRHLHGPHGDQFLHRPQRADRGAKRSSEKEREHQRQHEDGNHQSTRRVILVEDGLRDVLDRADRADAAFPPEPEPGQRDDRKQEQARSRPAFHRQAARPPPGPPREMPGPGISCHDGPRRGRLRLRNRMVAEFGRRKQIGRAHRLRGGENQRATQVAAPDRFTRSPLCARADGCVTRLRFRAARLVCVASASSAAWAARLSNRGEAAGTRRKACAGQATAIEHSLQFKQRSWRTCR